MASRSAPAHRRRLVVSVLALLVALLATSCGVEDAVPTTTTTTAAAIAIALSPPDKDALVVGAVLDRTGAVSELEGPVALALEAQVARHDAAGGVLERPVIASVHDSAGDVDLAVAGALAAVAEGADVLVVGCRSDIAAAAAAVAADRGVPTVAACATSLVPGAWNLAPAGADQAAALAAAARAVGAPAVLTVADVADPDGVRLCDEVSAAVAAGGTRLAGHVDLAPGGGTVADVAALATGTLAGAVVVCSGPATVADVGTALRSAGSGALVLAGTAADGAVAVPAAVAGPLAVLSSLPGPDRTGPAADARREIEEAVGTVGGTALSGAAAVDVIVAAVAAAGGTEPGDLEAALPGTHDTVLGPLTLAATRRAVDPPLHLLVATTEGVVTADLP